MAGEDSVWPVALMGILVVVLVALLITVAVYASRSPIGTASKTKAGIDIQNQRSVGPSWVVNDSPYVPPPPQAIHPNLSESAGEEYTAPPEFAGGAGLGGVTLEPVEGGGALEYAPEVEEIFANINNRITAIADTYVGQPETRFQGANSGGDDGFMALFGNAVRAEAWTLDRCQDVLGQRNNVPEYAQKLCEGIHGQVFNIGRNFQQLS